MVSSKKSSGSLDLGERLRQLVATAAQFLCVEDLAPLTLRMMTLNDGMLRAYSVHKLLSHILLSG